MDRLLALGWRGGLTLFEVVLALGILALVGVALAGAMREGGLAALDAAQERRAALGLQGFLDEHLAPGMWLEAGEIGAEDVVAGLRYRAEVMPLEVAGGADGRGEQLDGLFLVRAEVVWGGRSWQRLRVETARYSRRGGGEP
jgi:hypothetical protein